MRLADPLPDGNTPPLARSVRSSSSTRLTQPCLGFCPGAVAEYARTEADKVVPKPGNLTFEQAAALPIAATTALRGVRDTGHA
jgi:NADPH:quinone reductase-like Zn-dependent oxidoreductase